MAGSQPHFLVAEHMSVPVFCSLLPLVADLPDLLQQLFALTFHRPFRLHRLPHFPLPLSLLFRGTLLQGVALPDQIGVRGRPERFRLLLLLLRDPLLNLGPAFFTVLFVLLLRRGYRLPGISGVDTRQAKETENRNKRSRAHLQKTCPGGFPSHFSKIHRNGRFFDP